MALPTAAPVIVALVVHDKAIEVSVEAQPMPVAKDRSMAEAKAIDGAQLVVPLLHIYEIAGTKL